MMSKLTRLEKHWILYDVGNSAFIMMVSTILPIYFKNMASEAGVPLWDSTAYWGYASSIATVIVALLGPVLGAVADTNGYKKPLFTASLILGAAGCIALSFPYSWMAFLVVFVIAKVGYSTSLVFYDSMLTDITTDKRMDNVSSHGYAWGYIGSCIPFTAGLALILFSGRLGIGSVAATSLALIITAVWWVAVSVPLIKNYKQVYFVEKLGNPLTDGLKRIASSLGSIRQNKKIFLFLLAFFFYIDGVYTIISMATSYGKDVGISDNNLLLALLLTQVVAFPCSILFGRLSKKLPTEWLIGICIIGYFLISIFALQLDRAWEFWFLAVCVAVFQGAIQALSRSYFAKIIPKEKSNEYFGFFDIFGKGAAFMGTTVMGVSTQISGSSKAGVASIALMFLIGAILFGIAVKEGAQKK
ncbi:MFS transporter [Anaerobacterium chartisolvens]|nr:MFS transporter [Anaerobacterium chartisolvens]